MNLTELADFIYEDINAQITHVKQNEQGLELRMVCDDPREDRKRHFQVLCRDVKDVSVTPGWVGTVQVVDDHPLLWDFTDDIGYLAFSSAPATHEVVIVRLYEVHLAVYSHWRPFSKYVNHHSRNGLTALLAGGMGMLADGPLRIVQAYQKAVDRLLETSLVRHELPQKPALKGLLLDGAFVLAGDFRACEVRAT